MALNGLPLIKLHQSAQSSADCDHSAAGMMLSAVPFAKLVAWNASIGAVVILQITQRTRTLGGTNTK